MADSWLNFIISKYFIKSKFYILCLVLKRVENKFCNMDNYYPTPLSRIQITREAKKTQTSHDICALTKVTFVVVLFHNSF